MTRSAHRLLATLALSLALATVPVASAMPASELDELARTAQQLSWEQRFDEALEIYAEVLARDPAHPLARIEQAKVLSWSGRFDEATAAFRAVLEEAPGDLEARLGLARVLSWSGRYAEARAEYERVLAARPGDGDALLGVAQTWAWSGDLDKARSAYEEAGRAAPDSKYVALGLAYLDLWQGSHATARARAERLAGQYPGDDDVRELVLATRRATAPWARASWDQVDDSDRNLLTTSRLQAGVTPVWGPALGLSYADYDVRTAGRTGSIRSLQGTATFVPALGHSLEFMLGRDRLELAGFDDHDVTDWGLRWRFPLPSGWSGNLDARREPFRYSVPLIENRIVIDSYTAAAGGPLGERWRMAGEISHWRASDDNARLAAELGAHRRHMRGEQAIEAGLQLRWLDWDEHLDTGYFDPSDFFAWGVVARTFGPVPGRPRLDYDLSVELGLQSFETAVSRTSNDRYYLLVARLGWQVTEGFRLEAWADGGSYASQGADDWRYTRVGLRFLHRFGVSR